MNAKITSNINLAKKLKKLESRQETVLAGVADHLTEDEKSNFNLVFCINTQVRKQILRLSSYHSNTSFAHMRSQTKWTFDVFHSGLFPIQGGSISQL